VLSGVSASGTGTNAGTYTNTATGTDSNYNVALNNGSLTIGKANAIVTANSGTGTYTGLAQNISGFTATGLVNGELSTVLSGVSASGTGTNAGTYTATAGVGSYSGNYNLSFVNGLLTIDNVSVPAQVNNVVTTIVNLASVTPPTPVVISPVSVPQTTLAQRAQTTELLQTIMPQGNGTESFSLVGTTDGTTPVQTISMEELQKTSGAFGGTSEISVDLGIGSLITLIGGGVNLPAGVSQEFYVVNN